MTHMKLTLVVVGVLVMCGLFIARDANLSLVMHLHHEVHETTYEARVVETERYEVKVGKNSSVAFGKWLTPIDGEMNNESSMACGFHPGEDCCRKSSSIKIWDTFTFNGDWEMFELRLGVLSPWVDVFVLLQANLTYGGFKKSFVTLDHPRIQPWRNCIRLVTIFSNGSGTPAHVSVTDTRTNTTSTTSIGTWPVPVGRDDVEVWFRDHAVHGYYTVGNSTGVLPNDWVLYSDLDEIPNPLVVIWAIEYHSANRWFVLYFKEYQYGYWNERINHMAPASSLIIGRDALKYRMAGVYIHGRRGGSSDVCRGKRKKRYAQRLLVGNGSPMETACTWASEKYHPRPVLSAGWHCSNCFPSVARIMLKLCAFGWMHDLLALRGYSDPASFIKVVKQGKIVHSTSRKQMAAPYKSIDGWLACPPFARQHPDRFGFLTSADNITLGNFTGCPKK
eukprot:TRINITY_DN26971_c0_g1_i1.p1 TRINITY_DN26971_c0_g1~~TRINITY_DN26971_c0_g1_i1.p1  ORF type:complete len:448 (+),score=40.16 TRINITY_DN26971_c0_g1_i1:74-1417(+)